MTNRREFLHLCTPMRLQPCCWLCQPWCVFLDSSFHNWWKSLQLNALALLCNHSTPGWRCVFGRWSKEAASSRRNLLSPRCFHLWLALTHPSAMAHSPKYSLNHQWRKCTFCQHLIEAFHIFIIVCVFHFTCTVDTVLFLLLLLKCWLRVLVHTYSSWKGSIKHLIWVLRASPWQTVLM